MVLAAVAGARRTDTAMPRFLAYHRTGANAVVYSPSGRQSRELGVLTALPEVARATRLAATVLASPDPANPARLRTSFGLLSLDPGGSWIFGRPMVVSGRLPDERRADEVVVDEELAARAHLWVGSIWRVGVYTTAQFEQHGPDTPTRPKGPTVDLRIVGVVRQPADLLPIVTEQDNLHVNRSDLYLTPAYWQRYGPDLTGYGVIVLVALDVGKPTCPGWPRTCGAGSARRSWWVLWIPTAGATSVYPGPPFLVSGGRLALRPVRCSPSLRWLPSPSCCLSARPSAARSSWSRSSTRRCGPLA
jgi:hypothetical protein